MCTRVKKNRAYTSHTHAHINTCIDVYIPTYLPEPISSALEPGFRREERSSKLMA